MADCHERLLDPQGIQDQHSFESMAESCDSVEHLAFDQHIYPKITLGKTLFPSPELSQTTVPTTGAVLFTFPGNVEK